MKRTALIHLVWLACFALVACSSPEPTDAPATEAAHQPPVETDESKPFDAVELKARLDSGADLYLLDVRRPEELAEHGAIEGYVNIPIDELEGRLSEIPKDKKVITYCMRGGRASRAAKMLAEAGHAGIQYGGITEWKEAGNPVVYPEGAKP